MPRPVNGHLRRHNSIMEDHYASSAPQRQLPNALQLHILSLLPLNERALSGHLVSPYIRDALTEPQSCSASLSQPLPPHAVLWAVEAGQQHVRQLPFLHKVQLLCDAAASGSEVNVEVALTLLQPSIFPELWYAGGWVARVYGRRDPGVAAVTAGHPQLLGVLLDRCPGLLHPNDVLAAAAKHCNLAGLQAAWEVLRLCPASATPISGWRPASLTPAALTAAARSNTPDAVAKMQWLMSQGGAGCRPDRSTAAAAARSGDLGRLRWLRDRGCPTGGQDALLAALQHADLAVAQWLVDEAGCALPAAGSNGEWQVLAKAAFTVLLTTAANTNDVMARLQWLSERGAPPLHEAGDWLLAELTYAAVRIGRVDVLQHLRSLPWWPPGKDQRLLQVGFSSQYALRSMAMAEYLWRAGIELTPAAYPKAAGNLDVVRWLAPEVSSRPATEHLLSLIMEWPRDTPAHSRGLLQAVQLLVGQVGCTDWGVQQAAQGDWQLQEIVCIGARRSNLALVQYLLQQQPAYQPGGRAFAAAVEGGCEALLEWLVEQHRGCLAGPWVASAYIAPAKSGDRGTLAVLRRLGVPWGAGDVVVQAVERWCSEPALRWLVEQGAPVGDGTCLDKAVAHAVQRRVMSAEMVAWLRSVAAAAAAPAAAAGKL